ncbi:MAG: ATP phosphoribosyltransferase [Chromatiaceae bacterium]|nr:ATP phosphoribosyltransferase [Chromatiaceae bacterium]
MTTQRSLTIALSKGRIFEQALPLLAHAGIHPLEDPESSRKLILDTSDPGVRFLIIRASDVPTYVQYGAADLGIAGKDVLLEHGGEGLYEPLDLGIARCRLMVAGLPDCEPPANRRLRIATKYVHSAERYFAAKGEQVELIKLYGSMELAPLVGLADRIVDLVESGNTLRANGLVALEHIADISSRLVVNKAAWKMKHEAVSELLDQLREALASDPNQQAAPGGAGEKSA